VHATPELRLVALHPESLGSGETRRDGSPEILGELLRFVLSGGVTPELRRTDDPILDVEDHEPMLLAGDPQAPNSDPLHPRGREKLRRHLPHRPHPGLGILLRRAAREVGNQAVGAPAAGDHPGGRGV
jgi:hypothetical protein